jgi:uncharacterized membrane protein (UPF0127 family)
VPAEEPNPLLDRPAGAPRWVPSVDDERGLKRFGIVVVAVLVCGLLAFVVRGADRPADPHLADGATVSAVPVGFDKVLITVTAADGTVLTWCLFHAATEEQRARGLMGVTDLAGLKGMVFSYDADSSNGYYMRNTPMPLSIAWLGVDGGMVSTADMAPCGDIEGCPTYPPAGAYRTAIEVPQGQLASLGIVRGSTTTVGGACPA